jgi:hypothetical protein
LRNGETGGFKLVTHIEAPFELLDVV